MPKYVSPRNSEILSMQTKGYKLGKKIGLGSYATIHLAEYFEGDKTIQLACKICDKDKAPKDFVDKFFPRELEILTTVDHPCLIQIHSILKRGDRVFIFMVYAANGDMLEFLKQYGVVPEKQAKIWFYQTATGLQWLHNKHITHRDLKCENILLTEQWNAKLTDYGFAKSYGDQPDLSNTFCGSSNYTAPEVIDGTPYNPVTADMWSLGVVLYVMVNASMPFDDSNLKKLVEDQKKMNWSFRSKVRKTLSVQVKNLITALMEPDPTKRLVLDDVLKHDWLKGVAQILEKRQNVKST